MKKKIILSFLIYLTFIFATGTAAAQTDCMLDCPVVPVDVSVEGEEGYVVPDFFENGTISYSSQCEAGQFTQSPAAGSVLAIGDYQAEVSLSFEGETVSC